MYSLTEAKWDIGQKMDDVWSQLMSGLAALAINKAVLFCNRSQEIDKLQTCSNLKSYIEPIESSNLAADFKWKKSKV